MLLQVVRLILVILRGAGVIKGASTGVGNLLFSGSAAQTVDATIEVGQSANRLGQVGFSNVNASGVVFNNDVYASSLNFANNGGIATVAIASSKTIDVTGNVTQNSGGSAIIKGAGKVNLSGSAAQTISSGPGASTSDRLGDLTINNASGVTLAGNNFLTSLTLTNGAIGVNGDKVTDVINAVNLSGKIFNSQAGNSAFGKIKSSGAITVNSSTNINFDYSQNATNLDTSGATQYVVAQSGSGISGSISSVTVSDNSFLFDNSLAVNGNNIVTTISQNANLSAATLGSSNYNLIVNALNYTDIKSGLVSLSNQSEITEALDTLKPLSNGAVIHANSALWENTAIDGSFDIVLDCSDKDLVPVSFLVRLMVAVGCSI